MNIHSAKPSDYSFNPHSRMEYTTELVVADAPYIQDILESTGFFYPHEIDVALELVAANLEQGTEKSGYSFIVARHNSTPAGFACFGKTPCTTNSFDLYWIAVHQNLKGRGIGKKLLSMAEKSIAAQGGKNIWVETSSRPLYEPTRLFYLKTGYRLIATLPEFYAANDDKHIYVKNV